MAPDMANGQNSRREAQLDIRELITSRDFEEAGLHKLSPAELSVLNEWLGGFASHVYDIGRQYGKDECRLSCVIESRIDGSFDGWRGDTLFELTNGQVWQQSSVGIGITISLYPDVYIFRSAGGWKMAVEGMDEVISVRRLK